MCGGGATQPITAEPAPALEVPTFTVDASWAKLPGNWVLGQVSEVFVDPLDHVGVLHRPRTADVKRTGDIAAPAVWELDSEGKVHGLFVDREFVWIGGNAVRDSAALKFARDGTFVMQVGRAGQSIEGRAV